MSTASPDFLTSLNPSTGAEIGRTDVTPPGVVGAAVGRAREAQVRWAAAGWWARRAVLKRWWRALAKDADAWVALIRDEVGKPPAEALAGDLIASLDAIRWTVRQGHKALAETTIGPGHQRFMQIPAARLGYRPLGVIGIIGTWNYPLFLNAPVIAQALAAGNGVVWKPSELAPLAGLKLQRSLDAVGLPDGLVSAVFGGPEVGRALTDAAIDKGVFTGGIENGRRVLAALAGRGIPAVAELSGFDAAVILPDAPRDSTTRSLCWGAFVGAGQTCISVKRVYVVGDPEPWLSDLAARARSLRVGDPSRPGIDMGPMISRAARDRIHAMIRAAVSAGARVISGGVPQDGAGWFYPPTVLHATTPEPERSLAGAFGPVVILRNVSDVDSAVAAANASPYGLAASVWSRNVKVAREVARRINAGMVIVNEVVTPTMHASAPFGGNRSSGYGRTHGPLGLREFVNTQTFFSRRADGFRPQLFPYGGSTVDTALRVYRRLFHGA